MTTSFADLPPSVWAEATDDELDIIIAGLEAETTALDRDWILTPRQQAAEDLCTNLDPGKGHEILYGGAAGGGKSQWMLWHLYHLALRYPGFSGLLIRRTFAQLTRTHIQMSFRRFDRSLCKFNQVSKTWRFANGSTIEFGYLDKASDVYNYDSAEYDTVCFDELTEWATPDNYLYLFSRIRTEMHLVEQGLVGHMVAATNPGRAGGAWVKARFIDFAEPMQRVDVADAESDAVTTRVFVPAKIDDNPHFGRRQYRANLMNVDAKRRKQLEDGDWDAIEGQYFDEWDRALHVREPFEIPQWWTKIRGLDWGITNPMCCLWAAFDGDGVCYIYRELYGTGMLNTIQARRVNEMTRPDEGVLYTMADPSIWTNTGNGMNTAEQYARAGLRCRKANNARVDGWARVREFLKVDEASGMPRLVIFNHCRNLIRTLPMLVHDSKNPEDLDTTGEDHAADCLAAGTRVTTHRGDVPIEDVRVGDRVLNCAGWQSVSDHWLVHDDADVLRVVASDGSITTATPSHRFWTEERGWVEASALRYGDTLVLCDTKMSSSTDAPIADFPTTSCDSTASTSGRWAARVRRFIERCGSRLTVRFPMASTFITSTTIRSTTTSPISVSSAREITRASTGRAEASGLSSASSVATSSTRALVMAASGSARTTASRNGDARNASTSLRSPARGVVSRLNRTGTYTPRVAPVSVVSVSVGGRRPVYDLTVDGEPEFFANGILVHNSLRYLLMSRPKVTRSPKREAATLEAEHAEAVRQRRHDRSSRSVMHPELGRW